MRFWHYRLVAFCAAILISCLPVKGQFEEPILTWTAIPNPAGTVGVKLDFVSPLAQPTAVSTQALPETRVEVGLGHGLETVLQMPLLRTSSPDGSSVLAAGQFSVALRYLIAGSASGRYAITLGGRLEVPSGDSTIVGNATQLMPMLFSQWRLLPSLSLRSNLSWNTTVGATTGKFANFQYAHAIVWSRNRLVIPAFEVAGSTSTLTGNSLLVVQPEVILEPMRQLELKTGLEIEVFPTLRYAIRSQFAWFWSKRPHQ